MESFRLVTTWIALVIMGFIFILGVIKMIMEWRIRREIKQYSERMDAARKLQEIIDQDAKLYEEDK